MANIYTLKSGLASDPTVWSGGAVPVSGDRVLINTGHTVTTDGAYTWGDDSTATLTINSVSTAAGIHVRGTLRASRTASSTLTCRGDLLIALNGTLDYGTEADPIPAAVTAHIIANFSASMAHNKYSVITSLTESFAGFRLWGDDKTPRTTMSAASFSDTIVTVADATGWRVGDFLAFGIFAGGNAGTVVYRAITALSGNVVTLSASLGVTSQAGRTVINLTRNVRVTSHLSQTFRSGVSVRVVNSPTHAQAIEIGPSEVAALGGSSVANSFGGLTLFWNSSSTSFESVKRIYRPVLHDLASVVGGSVTSLQNTNGTPLTCFNNQAYSYAIEELVCSSNNQMAMVQLYGGTSTNFVGGHIMKVARLANGGYSHGPVGCTFSGVYAEGLAIDVVSGTGISVFMEDCTFNGVGRVASAITAFGELRFLRCNFGGTFGIFSAPSITNVTGSYGPFSFVDCVFHPVFGVTRHASFPTIKNSTYFNFKNKNNDVTQQEIYRRGGKVLRDNATFKRGQSSLSLASWFANEPIIHAASISVGAGASVRIRGSARFNTAYGATTPPTLTVSGMGVAPVLWTSPAVADEWHDIDLTVTNPQSYPGAFTLDFSAMSAADTGTALAWFDGIAVPDFVTWTRHYGFTFDPANPARTVNPVTQLTEAQASALTGISFADGTLTVSEPHTMREVYDWVQWYECANRLDPTLTSGDGVAFALSANLVLSAALTGLGTLAMPGYTLTRTGTSTVGITHSTGVLTNISVTGLLAGSRIQLVDMSNLTEIYSDVPGESLSLNINWSSNKILRLRVGYAVGTTAMMPIETIGILSATGASFLVNQVPDVVYNALAIDGGACTEFAPDFPNLQIDLSDGDGDGATSVQRLYAWAAWSQTSAAGMALMFGGVTAQDTANFVINTDLVNAKLDNVLATPVMLTGGYLSRSDGSTVIAADSGSIQMDAGKAYMASGLTAGQVAAAVLLAAQATPFHADVRQMNGAVITGDGTAGNKWRG